MPLPRPPIRRVDSRRRSPVSRLRIAVTTTALLAVLGGPGLVSTGRAQQSTAPDIPDAETPTWVLDQGSGIPRRVSDVARAPSNARSIAGAAGPGGAGLLATPSPAGYSPAQLRRAYRFDKVKEDGKGQIIGIVGAFDYPTAAADLGVFIKTFDLKKMYGVPGRGGCTVAAGPHPCFEVVYARVVQPAFNDSWALESSLDVQMAHTVAPGADILLMESSTNNFLDLFHGVLQATLRGASIISMSWGGPEFPSQSFFEPLLNAPGVAFLAGSGDTGHDSGGLGVNYPSTSPSVIGVGGTTLRLDKKGNRTHDERAWIGSGGGISKYTTEPFYQFNYPIRDTGGFKGSPDVAMNGDPAYGVAVYDSSGFAGQTGWFVLGGTSVSTPEWAGLIALANQRRKTNLSSSDVLNWPIYEAAKDEYKNIFFDVRSGTNGTCGQPCEARKGWDFVTGLGTPIADELVKELADR